MRRFYLKSQGLENKGATIVSDEKHNFICLAAILDRWIQKRPPLHEPKLVRTWKINSDATSYNNFLKENLHENNQSFHCRHSSSD
jgi:hypothetical protein